MTVIVGHTRFSLYAPGSTAWKASNNTKYASEADYLSYLFGEQRLKPRTDIFLNLTLPILKNAARDVDYTHIVSFSEILPDPFKQRLKEFASKNPFVLLDEHDANDNGINPLVFAARKIQPGQSFGLFRIDDDDLLSVDYFDQISRYVKPEFIGMQVSLGSGFAGLWKNGQVSNIGHYYQPMNSMGLLSIFGKDKAGSIVGPQLVSHPLSDRTNPVILKSDKPSFLQARHLEQDSEFSISQNTEQKSARLLLDLAKLQKLSDMSVLESKFPGIGNYIPKWKKINEYVVPFTLTEPAQFKISRPLSTIKLAFEMTCKEPVKHNALWSFELVADNGTPIPAEREIPGLAFSNSNEIRHFRYVATNEGQSKQEFSLEMPEGCYIKSVKLVKWARTETTIKVHNVHLYTNDLIS
ncbi:glycosyltransferase [Staphylococcus chromogenes]|nr:glycosyltransferase [Staphylococcus chromogenes]